jgi:hypothetical protein
VRGERQQRETGGRGAAAGVTRRRPLRSRWRSMGLTRRVPDRGRWSERQTRGQPNQPVRARRRQSNRPLPASADDRSRSEHSSGAVARRRARLAADSRRSSSVCALPIGSWETERPGSRYVCQLAGKGNRARRSLRVSAGSRASLRDMTISPAVRDLVLSTDLALALPSRPS